MTFRSGVLTGVAGTVFAAGVALAAWWIVYAPKPVDMPAASTPPAVVGAVFKEDTVNNVTLTPEAMTRLGIVVAPVEKKPVRRSRMYGGEVVLPPGQALAVAAPMGGSVQAAEGGMPAIGRAVRKGQTVLLLLPLLTPEARTTLASARVEAEGQVNNAQTQLEAARIAIDRARRLLGDRAGSQRNVDEAQAQFDLAVKNLQAAQARRDLLARVAGEVEHGTAGPIPIEAPEAGTLRAASALPGQSVPAGAALFEVADLSRVWVRVPVYVGDLSEVNATAPASVGDLTARPGSPTRQAKPAVAPPTANAVAATADLYYELDNLDARLAPGERLGVTVPLKGDAESLVVPWSAVIHDIHGGTWVYEQLGPRAFARRRVQVRSVAGELAVLASGPPPGTPVVTAGAAELFGTEVGFSK